MRIKIRELRFPTKPLATLLGTTVTVKGWVRTVRNQKTFSFIEVNDGSTVGNLQVIAEPTVPHYEKLIAQMTTGSAVIITGDIVENPGKQQSLELKAKDMVIVGGSEPETYPLQKKRHTFEFLRTIGHLRPRTNTLGAITRIRNTMAYATHQFFQERGFLYVHTPIITAADCEGAGALFRVTTLDPLNPPKTEDGGVDYSQDFFGKAAYLTVSGQLNGEIYACALSDIYTFGPTFRAENSNTARHLAEFWMIEPEMAFADLDDNMDCAEAYLRFLFETVLKRCAEEMEFLDKHISNGIIERLNKVASTPFERATYTYAIRVLEKSGRRFQFPVKWGCDLQTEHERFLAEEYFGKPVIITDYPKEIKAFYMRANEDNKTVAAMDVLVPKIGEIIGGSQREERYDQLKERILAQKMDPKDYWWYLELRKYGSVPHSGFGAGFERLVQFATGMDNIRDVIPFPRAPGNADF